MLFFLNQVIKCHALKFRTGNKIQNADNREAAINYYKRKIYKEEFEIC
jgi:hypothetical protein